MRKLKKEIEEKMKIDPEWDWREYYLLLGSDVKSLFPSLSTKRTARIVREQTEKSNINWQNIDERWLCLYVHLNRDKCLNLRDIIHLLPYRTPGRRGPEAGMGSIEARKRHVKKSGEGNWTWPEKKPNEKKNKETKRSFIRDCNTTSI